MAASETTDIHPGKLDELGEALLIQLEAEPARKINLEDYPNLHSFVRELTEAAGMREASLWDVIEVAPEVVVQIMEDKGALLTAVAADVVRHGLSYVRLQRRMNSDAVSVPVLGRIGELPSERLFSIRAAGWVMLPRGGEIDVHISDIVAHLNEIVELTKSSNVPSNKRALTEIERAQLVAVLETALNMLKSPMVEKGFLSETKHLLKKAAEKAMEKQIELAFSGACVAAGGAIGALLLRFL